MPGHDKKSGYAPVVKALLVAIRKYGCSKHSEYEKVVTILALLWLLIRRELQHLVITSELHSTGIYESRILSSYIMNSCFHLIMSMEGCRLSNTISLSEGDSKKSQQFKYGTTIQVLHIVESSKQLEVYR